MTITQSTRKFFAIASLMMAIGISIGAFGAHGLQPYLDEYGTTIYNKGVNYWFYNTLGLFSITFIHQLAPHSTKITKGFYLIIAGTLIFSTSLFILALTHIKIFGAITPIGGTFMIIGWILCMVAMIKDI
ncbi:MAG: DUF423 domain-containing protein [Campylobacterota bacterium]|nr:DUF423 domain-containing protein [Campylobacterota bacterium]